MMLSNEMNDREEFVKFLLSFHSQPKQAQDAMLENKNFTTGLAGSAIVNFIKVNAAYTNICIGAAALYDALTITLHALEGLDDVLGKIRLANDTFAEQPEDFAAVEYLEAVNRALETTQRGLIALTENAREVQDSFTAPEKDYVKNFHSAQAFYLARKADAVEVDESNIDDNALAAFMESLSTDKKEKE